ncbi:hypothetical protein [Streptomyces prunicolor]|uniref:hypothetical protein n=1 Tax=Streptomyces prunicolor TaxID=67348 RepID=UPI00342E008D
MDRSLRHLLSFSDPDGNGWILQEITTRLPGRVDPAATTFASAEDLARALRRAAAAPGEHEARTGEEAPDWPDSVPCGPGVPLPSTALGTLGCCLSEISG